MYTRKSLYDLPNEKIKHITLTEINDLYQLYEDGRIFSRVIGGYLKSSIIHKKEQVYTLVVKSIGKSTTFSKQFLIRKYFGGIPEFDFIQHVPLKGYEDEYEIYSDGKVFSKREFRFLVPKKTKTNWKFVCILDKNIKRKTLYCARAVWESFVGPIGFEYKLQFLDEDRQNCSLENLNLVMKKIYEN